MIRIQKFDCGLGSSSIDVEPKTDVCVVQEAFDMTLLVRSEDFAGNEVAKRENRKLDCVETQAWIRFFMSNVGNRPLCLRKFEQVLKPFFLI